MFERRSHVKVIRGFSARRRARSEARRTAVRRRLTCSRNCKAWAKAKPGSCVHLATQRRGGDTQKPHPTSGLGRGDAVCSAARGCHLPASDPKRMLFHRLFARLWPGCWARRRKSGIGSYSAAEPNRKAEATTPPSTGFGTSPGRRIRRCKQGRTRCTGPAGGRASPRGRAYYSCPYRGLRVGRRPCRVPHPC